MNNSRKMVYRGREDRVHIADGCRANMGDRLASVLESMIREDAEEFDSGAYDKPLCPGCYMTALFNAAVATARNNGQSLRELGRTLAGEFSRLAEGGADRVESVNVVLDSEA